jgi:hypothetical protein
VEQLPAELHGSGWAVQAVHGTLDGGRADTSDAIFYPTYGVYTS